MNQYVRSVLTDAAVSKIKRAQQHAENAKQACIRAQFYNCAVLDELKMCIRVLNDAADELWKGQKEYAEKESSEND